MQNSPAISLSLRDHLGDRLEVYVAAAGGDIWRRTAGFRDSALRPVRMSLHGRNLSVRFGDA